MMPPWHDVTLLTTFVISQVLVYSLHNMRGMLILSTLVLLLWTKSLLTRWYRTQTLTREFFKRLLYLLVTVVVSLAAVVVMWMPLYEAYACVASGLEPTTAHRVMEWRNTFFLLAGLFLALSSITQTDLVLKPSQVDNSSIAWVTKKISRAIYRFLRHFVRDVLSVLKTVERCTHVGGSGETKKRAAYLKHVDLSDDDFTDNDEEEEPLPIDSQALGPGHSKRDRNPSPSNFSEATDDSLEPRTRRLRSSSRMVSEERFASDTDQGWAAEPEHASSTGGKGQKKAVAIAHCKKARSVGCQRPQPARKTNVRERVNSQHPPTQVCAAYGAKRGRPRAKHTADDYQPPTAQVTRRTRVDVLGKVQSVIHTTSTMLQNSVLPPGVSAKERKATAHLKRPTGQRHHCSPPDLSAAADKVAVARFKTKTAALAKASPVAATVSHLLEKSAIPKKIESEASSEKSVIAALKDAPAPGPSQASSMLAQPSSNPRRQSHVDDTTNSFDSLGSDASSQIDFSTTSQMLLRSVHPRRGNVSPNRSWTSRADYSASNLSHGLSPISTKFKLSSNPSELSDKTAKVKFEESQQQQGDKHGKAGGSGENLPSPDSEVSAYSQTNVNAANSSFLSLSTQLLRCAAPSPPLTRSQTLRNQKTQASQTTRTRGKKRGRQSDD